MMEQVVCLLGGRIYTPSTVIEDGCVVAEGKLITAVGHRSEEAVPARAEVIEVSGLSVSPGLIDLHIHGMEGQDVASGDIAAISQALARHGITAFLPTLAAGPHQELLQSIEHLASIMSTTRNATGARMLGIYLEGPYLSPHRAGVLRSEDFRRPSRPEAGELLGAARGCLRIMTVAPELPGAMDLISWLSSQNVIPSVGHSDATLEQVEAAIPHGLRHATHVFNAMQPYHHRAPGVTGAVLDRDEIIAEIIADGQHAHPAAVRLLLRLKGVERTCLVSDAAPVTGSPAGLYEWLGRRVVVERDKARLEDGTLAGSVTPLNTALRRLIEMTGLPFEVAVRAATSTPAKVLSLHSGSIEVGRDADLAVFDEEMQCHLAVVQGRVVYRR